MNLLPSDNGLKNTDSKGMIKELPIFMAAIPIPTRSMSERQPFRFLRQMGLKSFSLLNDAVAFPCSATEISKGQEKWRYYNVPSLLNTIRSGSDIIFSSTSCGHMIKHEYSHLLSIPGAEEVAQHIFDIFEFLRNLKESNGLNTNFKELSLKAAYFAPMPFKSFGDWSPCP